MFFFLSFLFGFHIFLHYITKVLFTVFLSLPKQTVHKQGIWRLKKRKILESGKCLGWRISAGIPESEWREASTSSVVDVLPQDMIWRYSVMAWLLNGRKHMQTEECTLLKTWATLHLYSKRSWMKQILCAALVFPIIVFLRKSLPSSDKHTFNTR